MVGGMIPVWSALTDGDVKITEGTRVRVTEMHGTRVKVEAQNAPPMNTPPVGPPTQHPQQREQP